MAEPPRRFRSTPVEMDAESRGPDAEAAIENPEGTGTRPTWHAARQWMDNVRFLFQFMLGGVQGPEVAAAENKAEEPTAREAAPFYYGFMFAKGRDFVAAELQSDDPFRMSAVEIVERVLAAGYRPDIEREQRRPFPTTGRLETVEHDVRRFIVAVDPVAETISVQEVRKHRREPAFTGLPESS